MKSRIDAPSDPRLVYYECPDDFLDRLQFSSIGCAPINHNLLQIASALTSSNELFSPPYCFWTLEQAGHVTGAALYANPDGLVVSEIPPEAIKALVSQLIDIEPSPSRIIADPLVAKDLVSCLVESNGTKMNASISWQVGKLDVIDRPKTSAPGHLRQAGKGDLDLVESWGSSYEKEKSAFLDVAKFMSSKLTSGELYIWEDDVPTTIVTVSGRNAYGARVSSVFTPPRHRGYGYASSAVAAVCDKLLMSGCGYIVLTWRTGDPAGRLYQRLGFRVIGNQQSFVRIR